MFSNLWSIYITVLGLVTILRFLKKKSVSIVFFRKIGHHLNQLSKIANSTVHSVSLKKTSRVNSF